MQEKYQSLEKKRGFAVYFFRNSLKLISDE